MNHNNLLLATSVTDQFWIATSILATKLLAIHCMYKLARSNVNVSHGSFFIHFVKLVLNGIRTQVVTNLKFPNI